MLLILFLFPAPILQCLPMKKRTRFLWSFRLWVWFLFWWQCLVLFPLLSWFPVPGGVMLRLRLPSVFSCGSRVFCWVPRRSPGQRAWWAAESFWFSFSLAFLPLQSPILHLQSLLLQSPFFPASFKSVPASEKPVPVTAKSSGFLSTNWGVSRRSGSGYVVFECPNSQVVWDFGSLSRSIEEVDSISFEYTIVSWNMFVLRFRGRKHLLCGVSLLFLKMLVTPCLLVGLLSSLDSNLFHSSIDPLLMYSTSSCCVNVFAASYFV